MEKTYTVSDLKKLIEESSNEFKPVLGPNVENDDKANNGKAYKEATKRAKDYDGGLQKEEDWARGDAEYEKVDGNRTTLDYNVENASDEYKKRVQAQADGYTSEAEKNNGIEKSGDFSDNDKIYQGIKKTGKQIHQNEKDFKRTGLQASKMPEKTFDRGEMYENKEIADMRSMIDSFKDKSIAKQSIIKEDKTIKTVFFKKTEFLNETHMFSKIPDEFKNEGEQFKMKDKLGNIYLLEWKNNEPLIREHCNKNGLVESLDRMKSLFNYSSKNTETTNSYRMNEGDEKFNETLNKARKIIK